MLCMSKKADAFFLAPNRCVSLWAVLDTFFVEGSACFLRVALFLSVNDRSFLGPRSLVVASETFGRHVSCVSGFSIVQCQLTYVVRSWLSLATVALPF